MEYWTNERVAIFWRFDEQFPINYNRYYGAFVTNIKFCIKWKIKKTMLVYDALVYTYNFFIEFLYSVRNSYVHHTRNLLHFRIFLDS